MSWDAKGGAPGCSVCTDLRSRVEIRLRDVWRGVGQGCQVCKIVYLAVELYMPDIRELAEASAGDTGDIDQLAIYLLSPGHIWVGPNPHSMFSLYLSSPLDDDFWLFSSHHDGAVGNTASEASLSRGLEWIKFCSSQHEGCDGIDEKPLPDRILDLGEEGVVKLYETRNEKAKYACLSHCWGHGQPLKATVDTLDLLHSGISVTLLPLTLRNAVSVAKRLSIRYLWIDCLCILQDNPLDLQKSCDRMASVFENCFVAIAATKSTGPDDGLFVSVQNPTGMQIKRILASDICSSAPGDVFVRDQFSPWVPHWLKVHNRQAVNSPWPLLCRAWVFQERLLAPRILHFGPHELFFECRSGTICECNRRSGEPDDESELRQFIYMLLDENMKDDNLAMRQQWYRIVQQYTKVMKNLTFERDAFPAIAGLASRISKVLDDEYAAGLWRKNITEGLLWRATSPDRNALRKWRAPTWSWASISSPVEYPDEFRSAYPCAEVIACDVMQNGCGTAGEISSAILTLAGSSVSGFLTWSRPIREDDPATWVWYVIAGCDKGCNSKSFTESLTCPKKCISWFCRWDRPLARRFDGTSVECFRVARLDLNNYYLILAKSDADDHYRRLGLLIRTEYAGEKDSYREMAKHRTVTII